MKVCVSPGCQRGDVGRTNTDVQVDVGHPSGLHRLALGHALQTLLLSADASSQSLRANFGGNDPRAQIAYSRDGEHQFDSGAKGLNARVHLPIKGADGQLEGIDLLKMQLQQKPMMRHDPAVQRLAQFSEASQSAKARRPLVVVSNVLTSRLTIPFTIWRTQATTVSLCTSRPAREDEELPCSLLTRRRRGTPVNEI
jgi:hypothetical protein